MVDVLLLHRELSASKVGLAVRGALAARAHDGRAVSLLARRGERTAAPTLEVEERLAGIGSPPPTDISGYDQLRQVG
jgi:hypothetical protein